MLESKPLAHLILKVLEYNIEKCDGEEQYKKHCARAVLLKNPYRNFCMQLIDILWIAEDLTVTADLLGSLEALKTATKDPEISGKLENLLRTLNARIQGRILIPRF